MWFVCPFSWLGRGHWAIFPDPHARWPRHGVSPLRAVQPLPVCSRSCSSALGRQLESGGKLSTRPNGNSLPGPTAAETEGPQGQWSLKAEPRPCSSASKGLPGQQLPACLHAQHQLTKGILTETRMSSFICPCSELWNRNEHLIWSPIPLSPAQIGRTEYLLPFPLWPSWVSYQLHRAPTQQMDAQPPPGPPPTVPGQREETPSPPCPLLLGSQRC